MPARLILIALLALVAFPSTAGAALSPFEQRLEQAREEAGNPTPPRSRFALPVGNLDVDPAETVAAQPGQRMIFTVSLDRAVSRGSLRLELPATWTGRAPSGLLWAKPAELVPGAPASAALARAGRDLRLSFRGARTGEAASLQIRDVGIPAGDYRIPWRWTGADGTTQKAGSSLVRIHAPTREGDETPQNPWIRQLQQGVEMNATEQDDQCTRTTCQVTQNGREEQSETFIGVSPYDSDRILVQSNNIDDLAEGAFLSTNGGKNFKRLRIPSTLDVPGEDGPETGRYCCDPMSAEDNLGNIWFGGLSFDNGAGAPSRIFVNRIAAGTEEFQPLTVGLPLLAGTDGKQPASEGQQDKNLMTIDNSPTSPTYGRLYVVWNDTGGSPSEGTRSGNAIVISHCDTRTAGLPDAARCDEADNWTVPVVVAPRTSLIYADAAVGPDGRVYVTWWDFSSVNAIRGRVCDPNKADCAKSEGYGDIKDIATLNDDLLGGDDNAGGPFPFACPIPAQPGGRPGPSPGVEVDISNSSNRGRVYVSWGDLRPRSGVRRCDQIIVGTPPTQDNLTWDSFVASAPDGQLPGERKPSAEVATRLYTDADLQKPPEKDDKGNAAVGGNSDEWFPWIVVDQETGRAYGDFYSTRDSPSTDRRTTHFYTREIIPDGNPDDPGKHGLGTLTRSSTKRSDYSTGTTACCVFGNDYGDYTGIDSAEGFVFPVWTRRAGAGDDGDAYTVVPPQPNPNLVLERAAVGEADGADLDGQIEPGEPIRMFVTVKNPSEVGVTAVRGTLFSLSNKATVTQANSPYPDIAAGGGLGTNSTEFGARLASDIACRANGPTLVDFRVDLDTAQGPESVSFLVPVCAPATLAPADRRGTPPTTTPSPTATPAPKTTAPTACASTAGFRSTSATRARRGVRFGFERRTGSAPVNVDVFRQSNGRRITGERLVARFRNVQGPFTWNGRSNRGKRVGDGYYFVRFRVETASGRFDVRRTTLRRSNGRFSRRPPFYRRESCSALKSYKLTRPVFGGSRKVRALGITFRTTRTASVRAEVLLGSRVVQTYRVGTLRGAATRRLSFSARGRRRGDYRVRLTVRPQGGTPITSTLTSRRL